MRRATSSLATTFLLTCLAGVAQAGDAATGKTKSATCAGCHGAAGVSTIALAPHLAGQQEAYLIKSLRDYRDGKRNDTMMGPLAKGLSDSDIADLAAFYSALK